MIGSGRGALVWLMVAGCLVVGGCHGESDPPVPVTLPPLPDPPDDAFRAGPPAGGPRVDFAPPSVDRFALGGLDVVLVERHALPQITWSLEFPAGDVTDPDGQEGRASVCMYLLVQGGISNAANQLADMGSSILEYGGLETGELHGFALRDSFDRTLNLWAAIYDSPGMTDADLSFVRQQRQAALLQVRANPASVAWRVFQIAARGPHHPYARLPSMDSYAHVTLSDCRLFFADFVQLGGAHLYIAGDITHDEVVQKFGARLTSGGANAPEQVIPPSQADVAVVTFVNMPGASQSQILMWGPAPTVDATDYNAASTMMAIFAGGSINSRLGSDLREMMGSTYSVQGQLTSWKADTLLSVSAPVQTDKTAAAIMAMITDAAAMGAADVTDDELSLVRDGAIASMPAQFATAAGTLNAFRRLVFYDLPFTYFQDLPGTLAAVDKAAIRRAAAKYLAPQSLHLVVVGDGAAVLPMLTTLTAPDGALPGALRIVDVDGRAVN